jgi:hypothetical protein
VVCEICFTDPGSPLAYFGPVIYRRELGGQYRALYGQNSGRGIELVIDASVTGYEDGRKLEVGTWYRAAVHYFPDGTYRYDFAGAEIVPTTITDPGKLEADARAGVFVGGFRAAQLRNFEVWSDDPSEREIS